MHFENHRLKTVVIFFLSPVDMTQKECKYGIFLLDEHPWPAHENNKLHIGPLKWIAIRSGTAHPSYEGSQRVIVTWPKDPYNNYLKMDRAPASTFEAFTCNATLLFVSNGK